MRLRVYVDFHNADTRGRVRLNTVGSLKDLAMIDVQPGMILQLYDEEMEVAGIAEYSSEEQMWVASVNWKEFGPAPAVHL